MTYIGQLQSLVFTHLVIFRSRGGHIHRGPDMLLQLSLVPDQKLAQPTNGMAIKALPDRPLGLGPPGSETKASHGSGRVFNLAAGWKLFTEEEGDPETEEEKVRQDCLQEEGNKWLEKIRQRKEQQRQLSNISLKLLFPSHSLPKSTTMKLLNMKVFSAIRGGDLRTLKQVFEISTPKEIDELLVGRQEDRVIFRRPSNGREIQVRRPTPLMVAVCEWYVDIVDYIAGFKCSLDDDHTVDDATNNPRAYGGVTALHVAALSGKLNMVESLLRHGAQVNKQTTLGDTALFEACFEGHLSVVQYLIKHRADVTKCNFRGTTCLMIATYADNAEVIQYIVSQPGAETEVNRKDRDDRSALFYTVAGGRLDTLVFLLDNNAKITPDKHGVNILMEASHHEQNEIVYYLLEEFPLELPFSIHDHDEYGRNVLFYLVENKTTKILQLLLYRGVAIEPANDGRTFLMVAVLKNNKALVKYLLENAEKLGLNPNERDKKGRNCLFYCITGGDVHLFEMLIEHGVEVETSYDGINVLMQAVAKQKWDFTEHILSKKNIYGLDVNTTDRDGWSSLLYSVASANLEIFRLLRLHGAKCVSAADGRTVLMQAAAKGDQNFIDHILDNSKEYEVYINERDHDGWNALFYTVQGNHVDAFKLLIKRGAKLYPSTNGSTPLMEAVDKGKKEMVEYLVRMSKSIDLDLHHRDKEGANVLFYCAGGGHVGLLRMLLKAGCHVHNDNNHRNLLMHAALMGQSQTVQFLVVNAPTLGLELNHRDKKGRNVLFYCIEGGHVELLDYLISCGVQLIEDDNKTTTLMQACRDGNQVIVDYLLEHAPKLGLNMNDKDANGENALFHAVHSQRLDIVKNLLNRGADVSTNSAGINVLAECMNTGQSVIAHTILTGPADLGASIQGRDARGRTVFHHLVASGDEATLRKMAKYFSADIDADDNGTTLLMTACHRSRISTLRYLVEELKVDVHQVDVSNRCALFYAVESSNLTAVTFLLANTKRLEDDVDGRSALTVAIETGDILVTEALLKSTFGRGMNHRVDKDGRNASHYCAMQGREGILPLLLSYNCSTDLQDASGVTPLMYACAGGHVTMTSSLLRNGATIDPQDSQGQGPLHYCFKDHPTLRCVKILINYGVDIDMCDVNGTTPLMLACQTCARSHISIVTYLLQRGADPFLQDKDGRDGLDHCPFDADYVKGMMRRKGEIGDSECEALEQFKTRLMADLDLNSVLRGLVKEKVFTRTLNFEVMKRTAPERVPKLISILKTRGDRAFRAFCRVLKKDGEHELAYGLLKAAYRRQPEILV